MKNFLLKFIIIGIGCFVGQLFLPWWIMPATAFLLNFLFKTKGSGAFFSGFFPAFLSWFIPALMRHQETGNILTSKVANILPLAGNAFLLILVSALLAGLMAGLAGLTGNAFRNLLIKPTEKARSGYHPAYRR